MSTINTALAALCLCLAAGEASGNAVTVLASHVERHPEVPCALDLIPPLFQRADNDSAAYPPRLFVFGKTDWLDEFLRRFPSVASIYLFTTAEENTEKFKDFLLVEMMPSASIVLRLTEAGSSTNIPLRVRFIYWASFDSNTEADDLITNPTAPDTCHRFFRVMVTARPRGTTHVFSVPMPCDIARALSPAKGELLGVWSPGAGWSAPQVPLFPPLCASWRPPPDGQPLLAEMFHYHTNATAALEYFKGSDVYKILRLLNDSNGLVFETRVNLTTELMMPLRAADTCRLDVVAFPLTALDVHVLSHSELSLFPWELDTMLCIVPVGAGKPRPVLYPLTAEYTPVVWAALAAVVLTVVACLYLLRRDESVQELVLQTLSPLMGQPLDDRRVGPQIAVLGGWLLTCVVVVGAYQGQLLGFIAVPPHNGDINSWQDWLESDLVLLADASFRVSDTVAFGCYGLTEDRIHRTSDSNQSHIEIFATRRNASFFARKNQYELTFWNDSQSEKIKEWLSRIHTFELPITPQPRSSFVTTKGSPFEVPIRKILGRAHAATGVLHKPNYNKYILHDKEGPFPISLLHVMPVLAVYIAGNIFAVVTFLLEIFNANSQGLGRKIAKNILI